MSQPYTLEMLEPRRLFSAGDVDTAFGDHGIVTDPATADDFHVDDSLLLASGKILVCGDIEIFDNSTQGTNGNYFLARYNPDGSRDTSFGDQGSVSGQLLPGTVELGSDEDMQDIAVDSHGRIVALLVGPPISEDNAHLLIARFNADGSLDHTFNNPSGFLDLNPAQQSMAVDANDNVLVGDGSVIFRYTPAGQLDPTFGTAGSIPQVLSDFTTTIHPLPDGKILVAGSDSNKMAVARINADGSLDQTFGDHGITTTALATPGQSGFFKDVTVLPDGKILAVGDMGDGGGAVRYLANGQLDTTFGDHGIRLLPGAQLNRAIVDPSGRIYLAGFGGNVARLTSDGNVDPVFGRVFGPGDVSSFNSDNALLLPTGRLLIPGALNPSGSAPGTPHHIAFVARLTEDDGNPSPIALSNRVLSITGTNAADVIIAGDTDTGGVMSTSLDGFGRFFDPADIDRIDASGGAGDDVIVMDGVATCPVHIKGGDGRDRIVGSVLNDTLEGNAQRDRIDGAGGDDLIVGNGGNDVLRGEDGNDSIGGGRGNDYLDGGPGDDHLEGGPGRDLLHGGDGNDTLAAADGEVDQLFGDAGTDSASADAVADPTLGVTDLLTSIEASI